MSISYNDGTSQTLTFAFNGWASRQTIIDPPYSVTAKIKYKGTVKNYEVAGNYAWSSDSILRLNSTFTNWITTRSYTIAFNNNTSLTIVDNFWKDQITTLHIKP